MDHIAPPAHYGAREVGTEEPIYFPGNGHKIFGWLYRPACTTADLGLVICNPFGYEALSAHRSIRTFAQSAVELGLPVLRFDYLGTGDSADLGPGADQVEAWTFDVVAAIEELKQRTGVTRTCLMGVRLGATLALRAIERCPGINALLLIAPVVNGRRYLRELRTAKLAAALRADDEAQKGAEAGSAPDAGMVEFSGHFMNATTIATLAQFEAAKLAGPQVRQMLVIDRSDLPGAQAWSDSLITSERTVRYLALPGFVEMALVSPELAVVPQAMVEEARNWLRNLVGAAEAHGPGRIIPAPMLSDTRLSLPAYEKDSAGPLVESPVRFGPDGRLFGIVTEPSDGSKSHRAVILLNAGVDFHIGVSRMHVTLARQWARRGCVVLRMDLTGLGDSSTPPGCRDDEVFPACALEDIRAAMELMRGRCAADDVILGGLCSGAYHALRAAAAGFPVNRLLMINPQNYYWRQSDSLESLQLAEVVRNPGVYRKRIYSAVAWRRLFGGQVNLWRIVRICTRRPLLAMESVLRELARSMNLRLSHDLGWELQEICSRDVEVVFVFARGEPGIGLLKLQAGSAIDRVRRRCRVHVVEGGDHAFSQSRAREAMFGILNTELFGADPAVQRLQGPAAARSGNVHEPQPELKA